MTAPMPDARLEILAEGPDWVAVNKPPGRLVHNSAWAGPREYSVAEQVCARFGRPLHPVHRLDRGTSGVLLFASDADAVAKWQAALASRTADKRYLAIVRGRTLEPQIIDHPVKRDKRDARRIGAVSELLTATPSAVERCSLVQLRVHTGRWHQARQHLAHLRHPVLGDADHGDTRENRRYRQDHGLRGLALHAVALRASAASGEPLNIVAPLPPTLAGLLHRLKLEHAAGLPPAGDKRP